MLVTERHSRGLRSADIARDLGISYSFVRELINDPTGAKVKARKQRYAGKCERCGGATTGCNGAAAAPKRCADCAAELKHSERHWTSETVVAAIQVFAARHGRPPTATECLHGERDGVPPVSIVQREFGSWLAGVRAAGFEVPGVGKYERTDETRAKMSAAQSVAGIEWTPDLILAAIREWTYKHDTPPTAKTWRRAAMNHPAHTTVQRRFGSWNAAIAAAGYEPMTRGQRRSLHREQVAA
jgi:hypothetical protein